MSDDATPAKVRLTDGLGALVARLQACADDPMWANHAEVPKALCAAAAQALEEANDLAGHYMAQRDALRKDAERYRWLRNAENGGEFSVGQQCSVCDEYPKYEEVAWYYDIELDGLIDAAMQRTKAVGAA